MADYRQIHTQIWKDGWFLDLPPDGKLLFIYLFSNERASIAGIYELPLKVIAFETELDKDRVVELLELFDKVGKVHYDFERSLVWIVNLRKYNESASPKVQTRITRDLDLIPDCELKRRYIQYHSHIATRTYPIDTDCIPRPESGSDQEQEQEQEKEQEQEQESGAGAPETPPRDFLDDVLARAKKPKSEGKPKGWETVTESEFAVCKRVADLWCFGKLTTGRWGDRIEKQCAGADELLEYHGGDLQACLLTIDKYHEFYSDDGADFSVAGPQSLVGVIPGFMAGSQKPPRRHRQRDGPRRREYEPCTEAERQAVWAAHGGWMREFVTNKREELDWRVDPLQFQAEIGRRLKLGERQIQALCEAFAAWEAETAEPLDVETFFSDG